MVVVTKPKLQRKRLFQAAFHQRYKHLAAPLSSELKKSHSTNTIPVRAGDTVRIMRGERKGVEGKVSRVDRKKYRIFIEGATREKVDGTAIPIPIHPSKVMIIGLNLDDKWRREILKRKKEKVKALEKAEVAAKEEIEEKIEKKPKTRKKVAKKKEQPKKRKTKRKTTKKTKTKKKETEGE